MGNTPQGLIVKGEEEKQEKSLNVDMKLHVDICTPAPVAFNCG
jgi:hypothetical protein